MEEPQKQKIVNMREIQNDFITGLRGQTISGRWPTKTCQLLCKFVKLF